MDLNDLAEALEIFLWIAIPLVLIVIIFRKVRNPKERL